MTTIADWTDHICDHCNEFLQIFSIYCTKFDKTNVDAVDWNTKYNYAITVITLWRCAQHACVRGCTHAASFFSNATTIYNDAKRQFSSIGVRLTDGGIFIIV